MAQKKYFSFFFILAVAACASFLLYLFRPLSDRPTPPDFHCVNEVPGTLVHQQLRPVHIYGVEDTYKSDLVRTATDFSEERVPPVYMKSLVSFDSSGVLKLPSKEEIILIADNIEPGLGPLLEEQFEEVPPLLDYEVELAFVVLESIEWDSVSLEDYSPKLGYFIANDFTVRSLMLLGLGQPNEREFIAAAKSFPGFCPIGDKVWAPLVETPNSLFCTQITCTVNGEVRQVQFTEDMIYTPKEILAALALKFPEERPQPGDVVLMGSPLGSTFETPAWKNRFHEIVGTDRLGFLQLWTEDSQKFLQPGDEVQVAGGILGEIQTQIIE